MDKLALLVNRIKEIGESYLMFSGGLDSCAILGAAKLANIKVIPVWINNGFGRAKELDIINQIKKMGSDEFQIIQLEPNEEVLENPVDRCYYCKGQIITAIKELSLDITIMDGTTGSDTGYRPGRKALNEHGIVSPLAELKVTSTEAKRMAIEMGADKDIADLESCLATRVNYNVPLSNNSIRIIRDIEQAIIGKTQDYNVRCRLGDADHIRIELSSKDSYGAITDDVFRNRLITLGENIAMFTTIDLKPSRPNAYDKKNQQ